MTISFSRETALVLNLGEEVIGDYKLLKKGVVTVKDTGYLASVLEYRDSGKELGAVRAITNLTPDFALEQAEMEEVIVRLEMGEDPEKIADYYWARRPPKP